MTTLKEGTREERISKLKKVLKAAGGNLVHDSQYTERVLSLIHCYGLENDVTVNEVNEIIREAYEAEVKSIATWSLQFEGEERDIKITNEVLDRCGRYDYNAVVDISNVAHSLDQ